MTAILGPGDTFPAMSLTLAGGGNIDLPGDLKSNYAVILFYRGHWWGYCTRQLAGINSEISALKDLDVTVIAASTDPQDKAAESAAGLSYPVAYGVTQEQAETLGAWWEPNRPIIQPTEFLLDADHKIITATYSAGPIGRMNAPDLVKVVQFNEKKRLGG